MKQFIFKTFTFFRIACLCTLLIFLAALIIWKSSQTANLESQYDYKQPISSSLRPSHESIASLRQRLELNPTHTADLNALASALFSSAKQNGQTSDFTEAQKLAERSLEILPHNNSAAKILLAHLYESQHDFNKAIALAHEVQSENPNFMGAYSTLVFSHLALGQFAAAQEFADEAVLISPSLATLSTRGLVLLQSGRENEGVFELERSLKIEDIGAIDESVWARTILARYYFSRGQIKLAIYIIDEALRIDAASAFALDIKAQILTSQENFKDAEKLFDEAFSKGHQVVYLRHAAEANDLNQNKQLALDRWIQAERLIRNELESSAFGHRLELAKILVRRNQNSDLTEAIQLLTEELKLRQTPDTYSVLALAYFKNKNLKLALEMGLKILTSGSKEPEYYSLVAQVYESLGQHERSTFYQHLTVGLNPKFVIDKFLLK